jgi:TolB-like protein
MTVFRIALVLTVTLGAVPSAVAQAQAQVPVPVPVDKAWTEAEDLYYSGQPGASVEALEAFLERDDLTDAQRVAALELLGSARLARKDEAGARLSVARIFEVDTGYRMNPEMVHPDLMAVYFGVLEERGALKLPQGINSVAIMDFGNRSITESESMEPLSWGIADALVTSLSGATEVQVVERERIDYVMQEIERSQTGAFDPEYQIRVGKLIGAQSLLVGGFTRMKDKIRIDSRLVETETGKILKTRTVDGKLDDLFDLIDELSEQTAEDLGSQFEKQPSKAQREMKALLEYSQGLKLMNEGKLEGAWEKFEAAVAADPGYEKAKRRLRQLEPLLAMNLGDEG